MHRHPRRVEGRRRLTIWRQGWVETTAGVSGVKKRVGRWRWSAASRLRSGRRSDWPPTLRKSYKGSRRTFSTFLPTFPSAEYHALSPFSTSFFARVTLPWSSVMTSLGGWPARRRSRATAKWLSRRMERGPEEEVALDVASASSAVSAAETSAVDIAMVDGWRHKTNDGCRS